MRVAITAAMAAVNSTGGFTSVLANSKYANVGIPPQLDFVIDAVSNAGIWTWIATIVAICVVYDQSASSTLVCAKAGITNHVLFCS